MSNIEQGTDSSFAFYYKDTGNIITSTSWYYNLFGDGGGPTELSFGTGSNFYVVCGEPVMERERSG